VRGTLDTFGSSGEEEQQQQISEFRKSDARDALALATNARTNSERISDPRSVDSIRFDSIRFALSLSLSLSLSASLLLCISASLSLFLETRKKKASGNILAEEHAPPLFFLPPRK